MKKILLIGLLAITIVACNKNQSAVKKIDGKWKAESFTVSSGSNTVKVLESVVGSTLEYDFESCKLKKEEACPLTITTRNSEGEVDEFLLGFLGREEGETLTYTIINDGAQMEIVAEGAADQLQLFTIKELESGSLIIENNANGVLNTIEFRR